MKIKDILNINNNFYQTIAEEFSLSRNKPWQGWSGVAEVINKEFGCKKVITVLDIGSGNGRFYNFLKNSNLNGLNIRYTGLDLNNDLLKEASSKYKESKFIKKDIFLELDSIKETYDLVIGFGITHHLPKGMFSNKWFKKLTKLLKKNGVLILTFWEFTDKPGDYLLGWNKSNAIRYCRKYSDRQINSLIKIYKRMGLSLIEEYYSDKNNKYLVFKKE